MGDQAWARADTASFQYVAAPQSMHVPVARADSVAMGGGPAASRRVATGGIRPGSARAGLVPRRAPSIMPVIRQQMRTAGPVAAPAPTVPKISSQGFRVEHKGSYQGEVKVPEILLMGKAKRIQNASVGRQMRAELTKYKLRPGALDDLGEEDEEEKEMQRDFKSTSPTQTLASSMGSRAVSPMSLRGKGMGSFAYDQQPYGGTREMRSLQRQIAETEDAAHESRLETERVLARTQDTRRKVEERVGRVKENNHQLDSELGEIERQIEELKKVSRAQMDEIRALRDTNRAKDSALRDEHKVLEGMEMSVKDAMAAAREERVRRQEEAERKAKAIAKAKEEEEEAKKKAQENKKAAENRGGADSGIDELLYDGDRAEVIAPHPELDALIAAQPVALNFA